MSTKHLSLRVKYGVIIAMTIVAGLTSRKVLPGHFSFVGDILWALVLLFCCAIVRPLFSYIRLGLVSALIAASVEASHLVDSPLLASIRPTLIGRLVLGRGFAFSDIGLYLIGIAAGLIVKKRVDERSRPLND